MKIKIDIYKLTAYDLEYVIQFGPDGTSRLSKLGWLVDNFLLPLARENVLDLFPGDFNSRLIFNDSHPLAGLSSLMIKSLENIFEAEYRAGEIEGKRPGERQIRNIVNKFIPFMYTDIRNAKIEYKTNSRTWKMTY